MSHIFEGSFLISKSPKNLTLDPPLTLTCVFADALLDYLRYYSTCHTLNNCNLFFCFHPHRQHTPHCSHHQWCISDFPCLIFGCFFQICLLQLVSMNEVQHWLKVVSTMEGFACDFHSCLGLLLALDYCMSSYSHLKYWGLDYGSMSFCNPNQGWYLR